jgi:F0F1-type ATP synthase gamma subunit
MKLSEIKNRLESFRVLKTVIETKKVGVSINLAQVKLAITSVIDQQLFLKRLLLTQYSKKYIKSLDFFYYEKNKKSPGAIYLVFASDETKLDSINNQLIPRCKDINKKDIVVVIGPNLKKDSEFYKFLVENSQLVINMNLPTNFEKNQSEFLEWSTSICETISSVIVPMFKRYKKVKEIKSIFGAGNVGYFNKNIFPIFKEEELIDSYFLKNIKEKKYSDNIKAFESKQPSVFPTSINFTLSSINLIVKQVVLEALYNNYCSYLLIELFKLDNVIEDIEERISKMKIKYNGARQEAITSELAIISAGVKKGEE